jgi:hypothetical protein
MSVTKFEKVIQLIDDANAKDIKIEKDDNGKNIAKELIYGQRMGEMIERFAPDADEVNKIAVHGQHIQRWTSPRSDYPMNKKGYHLWRTRLYSYHADTVCGLMEQVGYDKTSIERVKLSVGKKALKTNADTQMLENIAAMVFIEYYMQAMADKFNEYSEEKWIDIIQKTWRKMDEKAQQFTLAGNVKLPEPLVPLIQKALAG